MNGTADVIYHSDKLNTTEQSNTFNNSETNDKLDKIELSEFTRTYSLPATPELLFRTEYHTHVSSVVHTDHHTTTTPGGLVCGNESMMVEDLDLEVVRTNTDVSIELASGSRDQLVSRDGARDPAARVSPLISADTPTRAPCPGVPKNKHTPTPHHGNFALHPDYMGPTSQQLPSSISEFGWYLVLVTFVAAGVVGYLIFRLRGDTISVVLSVVVGLTVVLLLFVYFLVYCVVPRRRHKQFATYS